MTMDQYLNQIGVDIEARDVMDNEELAEYCRKQGGKPDDKGYIIGKEPPYT